MAQFADNGFPGKSKPVTNHVFWRGVRLKILGVELEYLVHADLPPFCFRLCALAAATEA